MIPETLTYRDLDGNVVTKEWYFSLDRAELAEMKIRHEGPGQGSLESYLERIAKEQDNNKLLDNFKAILFNSVALRPAGANYLDKSDAVRAEFTGGGAYETMFMKMLSDAAFAAKLVNGIVPEDMAAEAAKRQAEDKTKEYTDDELRSMTEEDFVKAAGGNNPMRWDNRFLLLASQRKIAA